MSVGLYKQVIQVTCLSLCVHVVLVQVSMTVCIIYKTFIELYS